MRSLFFLPALAVALAACGSGKVPAPVAALPAPPVCGLQPDGSRTFRILHLNDVYRIEGLADGRGGLARVRTLRRELETGCEDGVLLTHAGDALYPSLLSRRFDGAQMIDVLNALDGAPESRDPRMVATFGNHEFDKSRAEHAAMLQQRVRDSQFPWLDTNISWAEQDGELAITADNLHSNVVLDVAGVRVGVFGLTIDSKVPAYVSFIDTDHIGVARTQTADLREQGAEVVVALTHLDASDDAHILSELGDAGPDLLLGGHDHALRSEVIGGRPLLKGDADAVRVRSLQITVSAEGALTWKADESGVRLGPDTPAPDPDVITRVKAHQDAFEADFCEAEPSCLARVLTTTRVTLLGEETRIRRYETNLGNWVADRMRDTFPQADVAVINSGALRLNQDMQANTPITRQIVEELFAYPASMHQLTVSGATLQQIADRSVQDWTGQGHWLQVSGLVMRHDPESGSATDLHLATADGLVPIEPGGSYRLVTVRYLLDGSMGDQDGYTMLSMDDIDDVPANGTDLKPVVLKALEAAGEGGIAPTREGRICNTTEVGAECLLP